MPSLLAWNRKSCQEFMPDPFPAPTALNQYSAVGSLAPVYDTDGNMTSGPIPIAPTVNAALAWDGENRQLNVTPNGGGTTTYLRDAMGRRVAKTTGSTRTYFIYDGWNLIAEYTGAVHTTGTPPALTLERTHIWGPDISGSLQGAGGVGGLLRTYLHTAANPTAYYPVYDGNGNITEYFNNSFIVMAHYEYDPFGNDITPAGTAGSLHNSFPFRFSTKYLDAESGQYHYIGRDYNQWLGRWNSRDPIGERGGVNPYGFAGNDGVDSIDILGWFKSGEHRDLTASSFNNATSSIDEFGKDPLWAKYQGAILGILQSENVGQDGGAILHTPGSPFGKLERHYNRPFQHGENIEVWEKRAGEDKFSLIPNKSIINSRIEWEEKFRSYLQLELRNFNMPLQGGEANLISCKQSLSALGRVTHSWQDFYAHAIHAEARFNVWVNGLGGDPSYHGNLWPSSYNDWLAIQAGEHPNWSEPTHGHEETLRKTAAIDWVATQYKYNLMRWFKKCRCVLEAMKSTDDLQALHALYPH